MSEKLCVFCKYFDWSRVEEYSYSSYTSGIDGGATCKKNHYYEERPDDTDEFRQLILKAEKCDDYDPDTGAKP